ncbi:MAG: hypothetical protein H6673_00205 [Anaerolineales bacterium]|nr:hypothetical protein [Anaerolineales bacterium]
MDENDGLTVSIPAADEVITSEIFIIRGTPETLVEQGIVSDATNPRRALLSIAPDTRPRLDEDVNPTVIVWTVTQVVEDMTQAYYLVPLEDEWVFIRTQAPTEQFDEAQSQIFAPFLASFEVLEDIPLTEVFGSYR